jgi:predicted GH43/DUF377 family glycosyl hydrolase
MAEFKLKRVNGPILEAIPKHGWESRAVLNPGTVREGNIVHMLYRAVEGDNFSTIGYAKLSSEGKVLERLSTPVIKREWPIEKKGVEDPRIVLFEDRYYIFYTGYDGEKPREGENARVMMAETNDFRNYRKIAMVGPDKQDKDAFVFPEKIGGKVAFMHRIVPNIQIAFFEDIKHLAQPEKNYWPDHLKQLEKYTAMYREFDWETSKIGGGPPPIRTDAGWLLIYHGVDNNFVYRAGAALLDEKNPLKVLARLPYPILEPEKEYERIGDVNMVVFPEGTAIFEDELQVYYGGADKVVGLGVGKLSHLINELWRHKVR